MKIADYNQMMAYLTRPEPLPQPKPEELLDLQEQKRKDRLRKTMEDLDPVLMDESVDFIEREEFSQGTKLKTGPNKGKFKFSFGKPPELFYADTLEEGQEWLDGKRADSPRQIDYDKFGKSFTNTEKNKTAKFLYEKGDISSPNFDKLNTKDKQKVRDRLTSQGGTFKKRTQATPFSTTDQNKILKYFPNAKFGPGRKYGFTPATKDYYAVSDFIRRGFKPAFTKLKPSIQKEIKEKFGDQVSFEKNPGKYGVNSAKNPNLYAQVKAFVDDPKPFKYGTGINLKTTEGWMLAQMDRAHRQGNTNFEPVLNNKGKIIGFKDKTEFGKNKIYYGNAQVRKSNGVLINKHVDFDNTKLFVNEAKKVGLPVSNFDQVSGLLPDGFDHDKVKLNDLLGYITKQKALKEGRDFVDASNRRLSEIHHTDGVFTRTTGNYQILPREINSRAKTIAAEIAKGNLKNVPELEKMGARVVVEGKTYGAGTLKPTIKPVADYAASEISKMKKKELSALQQLMQGGKNVGADPSLLMKAGFEEFVKPTGKFAGQIAKGVGKGALTAADLAISAGKGGTGLALGALLEADPIITGMSEGKDFGQTARDTFVGSAIDAIPGVNLGSLNEDLIKLADTEEQRVAIQNLIDYQKDYDRFTKDLRAFKSYRGLDQIALDELGFTASDLVDMENKLAKRFEDIQTRAPKIYNPDVLSLARELARKEAMKRKENLEGIQGLIFGDRMAKDPNFIENQIQQIMAASTGVQGATDSYADNYRFLPQEQLTSDELDERFDMEGGIMAANGGRIGFADGPIDPKRRTFMKIMAGIASLPMFSKFLGKSEVAKPIVKIAGSSTKMPDWFPDLINKVMFSGTGKRVDADLTVYEPKELPGISIGRYDDGRVFVEGKNEYGKSYEIEYQPPGYELIDEKTGKAVKRPGEFIAQEEVPVNVDPDGNADFDVEVLEDLDQILGSDTRAMEEFATGKKIKDMKSGEFQVGKAEADADRAIEEAADLDEID
jgi:hypothetical protein